jgi:hypothetical protein
VIPALDPAGRTRKDDFRHSFRPLV